MFEPRRISPVVGSRASFATSGVWTPRVLTNALTTATLVVAATSIGYLIAIGHVALVAAALIAAGSLVMAVRQPGVFVALLLLAILNGLPGFDLSGRLGPIHIQDCAVIALIATLCVHGRKAVDSHRARLIRLATLWSACLVAWWLVTVARSVLIDGIPTTKAVLYGRDFLYFAILLPVGLRATLPRKSLMGG